MSFAIDVLLAIIIIIPIASGIKRGMINSVMTVVAFGAALTSAWLFTPMFSAFLLETLFMEEITGLVSKALDAIMASGITLGNLFKELPAAFTEITERYGSDVSRLSSYFDIQEAAGASDLHRLVCEFIARPVAEIFADVLAFFLIFSIVSLVLKLAALLLDAIFKLPGLSGLNRFGGFIVGCLCAYLYAGVAAALIAKALPALTAAYPEFFGNQEFCGSILLPFFTKYGFFSFLNISPI